MSFHSNSFSHEPIGSLSKFTTRFQNNWAITVLLPRQVPVADEADRIEDLVEIAILSGDKLLELDRFGFTTALVDPLRYADLVQACRRFPLYDPNLDVRYHLEEDAFHGCLIDPSTEFVVRRMQAEVVSGIKLIREIVLASYHSSEDFKVLVAGQLGFLSKRSGCK